MMKRVTESWAHRFGIRVLDTHTPAHPITQDEFWRLTQSCVILPKGGDGTVERVLRPQTRHPCPS